MANISHVELGRTLIATIFMCLSTREKPINVFAYLCVFGASITYFKCQQMYVWKQEKKASVC